MCVGVECSEPPAIARQWAAELPEAYLDERVLSRRGPFVEIQGRSLHRRWSDVSSIPMESEYLDELEQDLAAIEKYLVP